MFLLIFSLLFFSSMGCNIPMYDGYYGHKSLYRFKYKHNESFRFRMELSIKKLKSNTKEIGIDLARTHAPPSKHLRKIKMMDYIKEYIEPLSKLNKMEDVLNREEANYYLWGPTDTCDKFKCGCDNPHEQSFLHPDLLNLYTCPMDGALGPLFGIGGKYTGLPFHNHMNVVNHVIYGKKLWIIYKEKTFIQDVAPYIVRNTSVGMYYDILQLTKPYMCVLKEGEAINIPSDYFHLSINLETTIMAGCLKDV